ncbi:MAG TPA: RtcB family protein [Phototrophicaceae bacterium]|nr:RtcB family protein [Phototrophicaceae bacterium]
MTTEELRSSPLPYPVWGEDQIDAESRTQMDAAMSLPISVAGALMPDAHVGYGLPIGGVLATENAVIPYAVGVDIACRVRLSIFPVSPIVLKQKVGHFKNALVEQTLFGAGKEWGGKNRAEHEVLDDPAWDTNKFLKSLQDIAYGQLGTSGSGNHFIDWGAFRLEKDDAELGLEAGEYLALLSHSGSRGVGYKIASHYSDIAMQYHPNLDKKVRHLAWLPLDWHAGQEYWLAMELAGRFASANHAVIHSRVAKAAGLKVAATVENHHNFAWVERVPAPAGFASSEREVIVHRKGATPAGKGVLGVIPGSMADPGFVVRGKGVVASLSSAAHGAGRAMSRRKALDTITKTERDRYLQERGVTLIGAGLDEAPQAYKPIAEVIAAQSDLVDIVGQFTPLMVRMDGTGSKAED